MDLFVWLESTSIANAIRTIPWMYPAFETAHYIGLALLVGSIMLIDLRMLGVANRLPLKSVISLLPWAWVGFVINAISGVCLHMRVSLRDCLITVPFSIVRLSPWGSLYTWNDILANTKRIFFNAVTRPRIPQHVSALLFS